MTPDAWTAVVISSVGATVSWCVWVSVSIFKHQQEIALLKQEIRLMIEIKAVLEAIRTDMEDSRARRR